jgi:hypothetical protein
MIGQGSLVFLIGAGEREGDIIIMVLRRKRLTVTGEGERKSRTFAFYFIVFVTRHLKRREGRKGGDGGGRKALKEIRR